MNTSPDVKLGRMLWGPGPLPQGAALLGTVTRPNLEGGALLRMPTGRLVQGNAGSLRTLPPDVTPPKGDA
jgi:hypothetical protein